MVIRPLDDRTDCVRSMFTMAFAKAVGLFKASLTGARKCVIKRPSITFSLISNRLAAI